MSDQYVLVCVRHLHRQNVAVLFWRQEWSGYTTCLDQAGKYTKEEVADYFGKKDDFPVLIEELEALAIKVEYHLHGDEWEERRIVQNTPLFWARYEINKRRLHSGGMDDWNYRVRKPKEKQEQ